MPKGFFNGQNWPIILVLIKSIIHGIHIIARYWHIDAGVVRWCCRCPCNCRYCSTTVAYATPFPVSVGLILIQAQPDTQVGADTSDTLSYHHYPPPSTVSTIQITLFHTHNIQYNCCSRCPDDEGDVAQPSLVWTSTLFVLIWIWLQLQSSRNTWRGMKHNVYLCLFNNGRN